MACISQPIVVILGATGTGKSKLAIEIAQKFNGEIISADSMQVYKGLDIITNKVTAEEQSLVKHHLLDFVDPLEDFHIHHFRDRALEVIKQLHGAGKLPVVVGGTHYYIESLLWQVLVGKDSSSQQVPFSSQSVSEAGGVHLKLKSEDSVACKPSVGLKSEDSLACKPSAVELRSEDSLACKPSAVELRSEDSLACKPSAVELRSSAVSAYQVNSETTVGCDTEITGQNRADASLSVGSDTVCYPSACYRYDAGSGENTNSDENSQRSDSRTSSSFPNEETDIHGGKNNVVSRHLSSHQVAERTYERDMTDPTHVLYADLMRVDPERAKTLHPNDRRKIIRSLEVWQKTGLPHSEHLVRQRETEGGSVLGGGLRYRNTVVLWVASEQEVLDARLDARVDDMLKMGLVDELLNFHDSYNKRRLKMVHSDPKCGGNQTEPERVAKSSDLCTSVNGSKRRCESAEQSDQQKKIKLDDGDTVSTISTDLTENIAVKKDESFDGVSFGTGTAPAVSRIPEKDATVGMKPVADYTLGIFQSIGFKEFHDYLVLSSEERESEKGQTLYKNGIERLKLVTRRYSRRQVKWIKSRFTGALDRQVPPMYRLDTTEPRNWQSAVYSPAVAIVEALLNGEVAPSSISPVSAPPASSNDIQGRYNRHECSVCERVFIGDNQWQAHLVSNAHKRCKERKKKSATLQTGQTVSAS
ncbi:tRNA dimethylallyltransferase [Trinorchestia longiramus]|nr:tRNA dimethylallyltransferase [Trinorchestia longiramus]